MNGITVAQDPNELTWEWDFFRGDYANRVAFNDHRFKFATLLIWNPKDLPYEQFKAIKDSIATVKVPASDLATRQLDLEYRKTHIGGCWTYYDDAKYLKWFEGRNN